MRESRGEMKSVRGESRAEKELRGRGGRRISSLEDICRVARRCAAKFLMKMF